jgi:hypothetical protein
VYLWRAVGASVRYRRRELGRTTKSILTGEYMNGINGSSNPVDMSDSVGGFVGRCTCEYVGGGYGLRNREAT